MDGLPERFRQMSVNIRKDRKLKEQFINRISDYEMTEIIKELTTIKKTNEISGDQELCWEKRVELHREQKVIFIGV